VGQEVRDCDWLRVGVKFGRFQYLFTSASGLVFLFYEPILLSSESLVTEATRKRSGYHDWSVVFFVHGVVAFSERRVPFLTI
jgi:hypothetical protein